MKEAWCRVDKFTTNAKERSSPLAKNWSSKNWMEHAGTMQSRTSFQAAQRTNMKYIIRPVQRTSARIVGYGSRKKADRTNTTDSLQGLAVQTMKWRCSIGARHVNEVTDELWVQILQSLYGKYCSRVVAVPVHTSLICRCLKPFNYVFAWPNSELKCWVLALLLMCPCPS